MNEQESLQAAINEEVHLRPYDPLWPSLFAAERERILGSLPGIFVELQHIGSTAIAGMRAKPIIDVMAGVESMQVARGLAEPICDSGYTTSTEFNATLDDRQWFMRWKNGHRTHHLHVVVYGESAWRERICFRDRLRADSQLAARYSALKERLVQSHGADREAYTGGKSAFVNRVVSGN